MQGSFITLPGSTLLAKADTKTSHYHNHSGPRWNPFTEYTFYFALDFYWPLLFEQKFMMNNYKYQNEPMVGWADNVTHSYLFLTLFSFCLHLRFPCVSTLGNTANNIHNLILNILEQRSRFSFPPEHFIKEIFSQLRKSNMKYKNEINMCGGILLCGIYFDQSIIIWDGKFFRSIFQCKYWWVGNLTMFNEMSTPFFLTEILWNHSG